MAKTIIEKVNEKRDKIKMGNPQDATDNQQKSIAAVLGGIRSPAWKTYMEQFIDTDDEALGAKQLLRLRALDSTAGDPAFDKRRAYLVANGTCGEGTGKDLAREVGTIDEGI